MPTAVLRRYTPPTCTLEIAATGSALSRWTDRTVVKKLRFYLSFDDPKLSPEKQVTVSGNGQQLEALAQTVGDYVQRLLIAAPEQIEWEPSLRQLNGAETKSESETRAAPSELRSTESGVTLQPQGFLSHQLQLGELATAESGPVVNLTALQLFDLANALEAYQSEALNLPTAERPAWLNQGTKGWAKIAAAAVLALGVTGAIGKFVLDVSNPPLQTASAPAEREVNSELNRDLFPRMSPPPDVAPPVTLQPLPPPPPGNSNSVDSPGLPPVGVTTAPPVTQAPVDPAAVPQQPVTTLPAPGGAVTIVPSSLDQPSPAEPPRLARTGEAASDIANSSFQSFGTESSGTEEGSDSATNESTNDVATSGTAFDTIPQVAEIRNYFQQRWQPPAELTQTLEYRLLLNADGSLQRIVPLGQAAANYIDRTNMPLMGEAFVSASSDGTNPQIRLVLKPDGKVQSFLEYAN